jgi:folate-binding protein YgfZ
MRIILTDRVLLKISGSDSELFLQNQLSNDIKRLGNSSAQLNAYCQHQGKIIALFWVIRYEGSFILSFPVDLLDKIKSRLQMFVIMSDVVIQDVTEDFCQIGLVNETNEDAYLIKDKLSVLLEKYGETVNNSESISLWSKACIDSHLPEVFLLTSEKLVPQMLNLDINEFGVNFSKGCYPGQEVVARLHYLGRAKRRLYAFSSDSKLHVGDSLLSANSKSSKASGIVINTVKYNSKYYCLATLEVDHKDHKVTLDNEQGSILKRINNE